MSPITSITVKEEQKIVLLHDNLDELNKLGGCSVAAAAFLVIGALIVIFCGSLCTMLPGINVVSDVILPAVVPGTLAIIVSIPLIIEAVIRKRELSMKQEETINEILRLLENYNIYALDKIEDQVNFILKNFLCWNEHEEYGLIRNKWAKQSQITIVMELQKKLSKEEDQNEGQKKIAKALEKVLERIGDKDQI